MQTPQLVPATDLERETGLGKDLLRKWRERYGFPTPENQSNGSLGYSREQVLQLRLIKRLLDVGFRPGQVVGKSIAELDRLIGALAGNSVAPLWNSVTREAIERLKQHDLEELKALLIKERAKGTLTDFVNHIVTPLVIAVGEAWARGEIEVYHEHLCSDELIRYLHAELRALKSKQGFPRIMFATPPDEIHVLGLLMAEAVLADQGANCVSVGPQIAMGELAMAVQACHANVVAMSFSLAYPTRRVRPMLAHLRELLPSSIGIWVGGAGASHILRPPKGVLIFGNLKAVTKELMKRV
jgi:DNA-binding transcriptional MerR regulator/methylmalonyl-CoA mutase cobalamin-binding subunit